MGLQTGQIVKNLIPTEPVEINKVKQLGSSISITYTGINSKRVSTKVISKDEISNLEILTEEGSFNFTGDPVKFALFAEAERINSAYQFDPLFAVNCSIVDPLPHQVEAVYKFLLPLPKIRFLLADDTGAGKTIMAGLIIKELMMRGLVERVLIVTPGGLTKQWQEDEMGLKFNIHFKLVNRSIFSAEPNVFHNSPRIITSLDFIAREDVLNAASDSSWDLIIFDETHKLSAYEYGSKQYISQRYKAAEVLAQHCEHILLLTATPHRGRTDTFKKLLQLLDPDIFATDQIASTRIKELEQNGINKFFIRRLKEDMKDWAGNPLFKNRFTKTVAFELTDEEIKLYCAVTDYLTKKKEEASETKNIHVSLALTVMQRRLVSSIFAIKNTLERRWKALQNIIEETNLNPNIWTQRYKPDGFDVQDIGDYEELGDDERDALDNILSDPRKFRLFTTSNNIQEIQREAAEVKILFDMAQSLYNSEQEEKKFKELQQLLRSEGVLDNQEKLVIFTEHKDTLTYLEDRLTRSGGYKVATIHGGKSVDERRKAQWAFAKPDTQILIATDAAGEGINLQFCRLLINWDIPWNPNRLEQRMGRIHRYGQKQDVLVFNMVASNTKEGKVLEKLLAKLDIIRNSMGDDRVYDVIQDVLEGVKLEEIINSVFNGKESEFDRFLAQDDDLLHKKFEEKIREQKNKLAHSVVDYKEARTLKENSDEKRLQPIYVRLFFEKALTNLGAQFTKVRSDIYKIDKLPAEIADSYRKKYNSNIQDGLLFCFDKHVFLDYQNIGSELGKLHFINPGNPVFDSLVDVVRNLYREDMMKGTILISPDDKEKYFAFFIKSQIADNRESNTDDSIADEKLLIVYQAQDKKFHQTSPAKFIDLQPPASFSKPIEAPEVLKNDEVIEWIFTNITEKQLLETRTHFEKDVTARKEYLQSAFTHVIMDLQFQIQELQTKLLYGDTKANEKIIKKQERVQQLLTKKEKRLRDLELMLQLHSKAPEILGCAYVVPLNQLEYNNHFGMSRDDEAEAIAMDIAMKYEISVGWAPTDVSANNEGFDIRSISPEEIKRYIEVKGRSANDGNIMLSENEKNRLAQLGELAWLYIVLNCKSEPKLYRIQNPEKNLQYEMISKGVQYLLKNQNWEKFRHE